MKIFSSKEKIQEDMPKLDDEITEKTKGDWKIWNENSYLDVIGVFYPYFTADYTISHRIRHEPVFSKDEYIKNLKYNTFESNKGGPILQSGGDSVVSQNTGMLKTLDTAAKGEFHKFKGVTMQEWEAFRIEVTDPRATIKNCKVTMDGDLYDGLKVQFCFDKECVSQTT